MILGRSLETNFFRPQIYKHTESHMEVALPPKKQGVLGPSVMLSKYIPYIEIRHNNTGNKLRENRMNLLTPHHFIVPDLVEMGNLFHTSSVF